MAMNEREEREEGARALNDWLAQFGGFPTCPICKGEAWDVQAPIFIGIAGTGFAEGIACRSCHMLLLFRAEPIVDARIQRLSADLHSRDGGKD